MPEKDSAAYRAIVTFLEACLGFSVGLTITIWKVPGVSDATFAYMQNNLPQVLLTVGIPSTGLVSLVWNLWRKDVKNY